MPKNIDEVELAEIRTNAKEVDRYDYQDESDEDNYICAVLFSTPEGRHFRVVEQSGFNSQFAGAMDIAEWFDQDELAKWKEF